MKRLGIALLLGLFLPVLLLAADGQYYFRFKIDSPKDLQELTKVISIDNVRDNVVWAYANDREWEQFQSYGYDYEILPDPGSLISPKMAEGKADMLAWDSYPTYETYVSMMQGYANSFPSICRLDTIGTTVQGRLLLACVISDNVGVEEAEPEVLYTSSMHGDETTGYILTLRLIDYLLNNYGTDIQVTTLVNNEEIWINPLANPDGTYHGGNSSVSGAQRYNANYVDLNRNYADPEDGQHPDGNSWQPETVAFMNLADVQHFSLSVNFHGGAEVVNYPWDTWSRRHADDSWWIEISRRWADSAQAYSPSGYMTDLNNGITNGYDWYTISGGRQDYMTYFRGDREATIEISSTKLLPGSSLPAWWGYNKASLLTWLQEAYYGIRGVVTDSLSGAPLAAVVTVLNHDADSSRVFTDPAVGDYYRMIDAGTWDLQFKAPGYTTKTITGVSVSDLTATPLDVQLAPLTGDPVLAYASQTIGVVDPGDNVSFYMSLVNWGGGNGNNVSATVTTSDINVTMTQDYSTFPTIYAEGGTAQSNSQYQFTVDPGCPSMHEVQFDVEIDIDGTPTETGSFTITVGLPVEDFETGDFSSYDWSMSGNQPWVITSGGVQFGLYAAASGDINDGQSSSLALTLDVTSDSPISFYYKVSSEPGYDYLEFYIDDVRQDRWAGEVNWSQISYPVSAGLHTFRWTYDKDGSQSDGSDRGWIDYIQLPAHQLDITVTTGDLPDWTVYHPYSQQIQAQGGSGTLTFSDLNGDLAGTGLTLSSSGLLSGTPTSVGAISFTVHVEDEGAASVDEPLSFGINPHVEVATTSLPDVTENGSYSQQLQSNGGTPAMSWVDKNDDLSAYGLALSAGGLISGTATPAGPVTFTAQVTDQAGDVAEKELSFEITAAYVCGDANGDDIPNVTDAVYLIAYIFASGPEPSPYAAGDANCDGLDNITDAVYLIQWIFAGGPSPCATCGMSE